MAVWNDTLFSMTGRVKSFRPNLSAQLVRGWINDRIRQVLDSRTYWSDLITRGILSVPNAYNTGTVTSTTGSTTITGTATAWPVSDVVNTTIPAAVSEIGYSEVTPASMAGITADTMLYVDAAGTPETVAVVTVTATTFTAKFLFTHLAGATITSSSLSNRQLKIAGSSGGNFPVFNVRSVQSTTQLTIDLPWGSTGLTASAYQIVGMYYTMAPDFKDLLTIVDPQYSLPLRFHAPVMELNWRDPQRQATGPPQVLYDLSPNENGNMQYELWPLQTSARQLPFLYHRQWPELINDNDRPPHFINPTVFIHGAIADALRMKVGKDDPYHNPALANEYERRFLQGMDDAKNADESKFQRGYGFDFDQHFGAGGANFWQSHEIDVLRWNF